MKQTLTAKSTVLINAPASKVWETVTNPIAIKEFMMGMEAISTWKEGEELRWKGRHEEKPEDNAKGEIITIKPYTKLVYTFYYPGYGYPDEPTYYNQVVYTLKPTGLNTTVSVKQGDFSVFKEGEIFLGHTQSFWDGAIQKLKELVESDNPL